MNDNERECIMLYDFTKLKNNLEEKGYQVSVFDTKEEAREYLNSKIDGKTVGFGGSVTLREMELLEALSTHNTVYCHDKKPENLTVMETRTVASRAAVYISSANAISEQGDIINIDGTGNRLAATTYGPDKVYFVIGSNKVAPDFEAALFRARNIAAPLNAKRLNRNTPCAKNADKCYNCNSPERICRALSVFWTKPSGAEYEIVLVKESLGY